MPRCPAPLALSGAMNGRSIGWGTGTGQAQLAVVPAAARATVGTGETDADRSTLRITRRLSRVGQAAANEDNTCTASVEAKAEVRGISESREKTARAAVGRTGAGEPRPVLQSEKHPASAA